MIELGICRYAGKGQGELSLLRRLWDVFIPGDVLLTDRLMCSWREMVVLKQRGIDSVNLVAIVTPNGAALFKGIDFLELTATVA